MLIKKSTAFTLDGDTAEHDDGSASRDGDARPLGSRIDEHSGCRPKTFLFVLFSRALQIVGALSQNHKLAGKTPFRFASAGFGPAYELLVSSRFHATRLNDFALDPTYLSIILQTDTQISTCRDGTFRAGVEGKSQMLMNTLLIPFWLP